MDRREIISILNFQARARGYLVRLAIRRAREDFEKIVQEIDGRLTHLKWNTTVFPTPYFTDYGNPNSRRSISSRQILDAELDPNVPEKLPSTSEEKKNSHVLIERKGAEEQDSHNSSVCWDGDEPKQSTVGNPDGEVMGSTRRSSTVWNSLELDINNYSHRGSLKEAPGTPGALRLHRNTLTMELLWLQQAIDSRKKYLSLKDTLSVSGLVHEANE